VRCGLRRAIRSGLHSIPIQPVGPSRPELDSGLPGDILAFADKYSESYCRTEAPGPRSHLAIIQANLREVNRCKVFSGAGSPDAKALVWRSDDRWNIFDFRAARVVTAR
jgi:hypothetical protein